MRSIKHTKNIKKDLKKNKKRFFKNKTKRINLNSIFNDFGVGKSKKMFIARFLGIPIKNLFYYNNLLSDNIKKKIKNYTTEKFIFGNFLKKILFYQMFNSLTLKDFRSFRFLNKLPCNGQRTKTNAKTSKRRKLEESLVNSINFRKFYIKKKKRK